MDPSLVVVLVAIAVAAAAVVALLRARGTSDRLDGRLAQLAASVDAQLAAHRRLGDDKARADDTLGALHERLGRIDEAQSRIERLSAQVLELQDVLSNKQARGAFGEVQLENLVRDCLPPSAYAFQATLGNGRRADCLLRLPSPPGPIVVDAKFPLESWHALRAAHGDEAATKRASRELATAVRRHVADVAARYIVPGETAESALLFLPSEAVYAELHARFPSVVEESYQARVWIVSPTTLMATLNTVRAVLRDVRMREQAGLVQREVRLLLDDVRRLDDRVGKLASHFRQAEDDVREIAVSTGKVVDRAERIDEVDLGDPPAAGEPPSGAPRLARG